MINDEDNDDVSLAELQKMQRNLSSNLKNADYLFKLGKIYYNHNLGSSVDLNLDHDVKVSIIADWQSHHSCIKHSFASFNLKPTIDSALLIMNSFNNIGDYSATVNFISEQNLMERFPKEKFTIISVLLHSLRKKGMIFQAIQLLYEFSPDHFKKAQQSLDVAEDSAQRNFQRISTANNSIVFYKGKTEDSFLGYCEELLDRFQRERNAQDYFANNIKWDYDHCFNIAVGLHKEGFIRVAMQMYALAFSLNPSEKISEIYSLASLHLMGEHQIAFEKLNQFTENYPDQFWAYVIAGHSCAIMNNISGLEMILMKSHKNNINNPFLDYVIGFYLESKGQIKQAVSFYEKKAQDSENEMLAGMFNLRVERIKYEWLI